MNPPRYDTIRYMIKNLSVRNFKSVRDLAISCKRVNVFIGKPNVGKSNILEAVSMCAFPAIGDQFKDVVRIENMTDLFYDHAVDKEQLMIQIDDVALTLRFENGMFYVLAKKEATGDIAISRGQFDLGGRSQSRISSGPVRDLESIKPYRFKTLTVFSAQDTKFLLPPSGENLVAMLLVNSDLKKIVSDLFAEFDFRLIIKPQEGKIEIAKEADQTLITYPYILVSDTLQRLVFHLAAMKSNRDSTLIFEEPEVHSFPYYTKFLAEQIAADETNQYFLSTHNPYFLTSLIEKTSMDDLAVFVVHFRDYQTRIHELARTELSEAIELGASVFFNLDRYTEA